MLASLAIFFVVQIAFACAKKGTYIDIKEHIVNTNEIKAQSYHHHQPPMPPFNFSWPHHFPTLETTPSCHVYLPFDTDFASASKLKFVPVVSGPGSVIDPGVSAHGTGSARLAIGSRLTLPGAGDYTDVMSACLFFRNQGSTPGAARLLSNSRWGHFSISLATIIIPVPGPSGSVRPSLRMATPVGSPFMTWLGVSAIPNTGFTQMCGTFDKITGTVKFYVNGILRRIRPVAGPGNHNMERPVHEYVLGDTLWPASFAGNIDEVIMCDKTLSAAEVKAHFDGPAAMRKAGMIP